MTETTIRRKDLKDPDEFITLTHRVLAFLQAREKEVTIAVIGAVVVAAIVFGIRTYRGWQESAAEAAFSAARSDFAARRFEPAANGFVKVTKQWPGTMYGRLAVVLLGSSYAELGKSEDAERTFRSSLATATDPLLRQIAYYNLGLLELKKGDKKAAVNDLSEASKIEGPLRSAAWFARLSSGEKFVENVSAGMQAINELGPEPREYMDSLLMAQQKKGGSEVEAATPEKKSEVVVPKD
jgi:predicted negative regulator of RcsB-dependent stress response